MKAEVRLYAYGNTDLHRHAHRHPAQPGREQFALHRHARRSTIRRTTCMFGLTGEMNIILGRKENALIVPARAFKVDQVLIVEDGVVEQRTVKVGFKSLEFAEILDGLNEGDAGHRRRSGRFPPRPARARRCTVKADKARSNGPPSQRRIQPSSLHPRRALPALYIGLRFTVSRKRSLIFSLLGVIFGVAFFVCTQAQTQGFEQYFIKTILGTSGAIVISDRFQNRYTTFNNADGRHGAQRPAAAQVLRGHHGRGRDHARGAAVFQRDRLRAHRAGQRDRARRFPDARW